ncbi:hypothetical protein A2Y83_01550 [Candidatus Falkowbacteria bacterium RBG_13_39_14]|uniref:Uncharacterized protein n=1 Tax=Candidatus Falkowbacteria bacterium RBG_13_39_14 TaxID=1797985 RepID=A0A1F5S7W1_9BACT|nr:MAG: hypothetical protein A2Y83_01550 [Candidatus Falkowbacteria bacterium RBG_13_39_14]
MNSQFNSLPEANLKKSKRDILIWWSISLGMILLAFFLIFLQIAKIVYYSIFAEGIITVVLFIGGLIIGIIALVKTYFYIEKKIFFWIPIGILILLLAFGIFAYRRNKESERQRLNEILRQDAKMLEELNKGLKEGTANEQDVENYLKNYYGNDLYNKLQYLESTTVAQKPTLSKQLAAYSQRRRVIIALELYCDKFKRLPKQYSELVTAGFLSANEPAIDLLLYKYVNDTTGDVCLNFDPDPDRQDEPKCKRYTAQ